MTNQEPQIKFSGKYHNGLGRRKRAIARVKLFEKGKGQFIVNKKQVAKPNPIWTQGLVLTGLDGKFDFTATVTGGGTTGQNEAIRLGIARAICNFDKNYRPVLRKAELLTRDPREKERKKPGLRRARRAPQWAKR